MKRALALVFVIGCAQPLELRPVQFVEEEPLRQSDEPFVENPRFCLDGLGGNACRVQPTPC